MSRTYPNGVSRRPVRRAGLARDVLPQRQSPEVALQGLVAPLRILFLFLVSGSCCPWPPNAHPAPATRASKSLGKASFCVSEQNKLLPFLSSLKLLDPVSFAPCDSFCSLTCLHRRRAQQTVTQVPSSNLTGVTTPPRTHQKDQDVCP